MKEKSTILPTFLNKKVILFTLLGILAFWLGWVLESVPFETFLGHLLATFKNARPVIFVGLFILFVGQLLLGLFWKPARKWGVLVFYFISGLIIAIVGHVVDYVTQTDDVGEGMGNVIGISYGDYGLTLSDDDYYEFRRK